ncbi:MAG: hypothetical protein HQL32_17375, partial [Planctomycetes bacterium]|nr:hypothetical protein [Planctomycetota bacterium]
RQELIKRIRCGQAFWYLPRLDDTLYVFEGNDLAESTMLIQRFNICYEFVQSRVQQAALSSESLKCMEGLLPDHSFWSVSALEQPGSEHEVWGIYETVRQAHKDENQLNTQEEKVSNALATFIAGEPGAHYKPHEGFPPPISGVRFRLS